ncbi:amino acid ABC transporter substrate-binding protein [Vibrio pectenicida]|uniref:Amino acid ABC transporter substrate-binding protein n=1 Tax=Vibrio pectenicida TaxID=62763 RepID=A0A7Y4EF47_9VIBR|nr:transporter substrate-binding domain-containing protein [Vibrio pectenicida]NOH73415.1 amino acid ABC transporter substrate-binding protein [Vibrio pectenicida]
MKALALAVIFPCLSFAQTVTVAADEWYPMNGDPKSDKPGFMIELAEKALALKGIELEYKILPWERAIIKARKGEIDCIVATSKDELPDFIFGQEEFALDTTAFFVNDSDSWRFNTSESLSGRKLGSISGYKYGEPIDSWIEDNGDVLAGNNSLDRNIKMLQAKRIDTIIESELVMGAKLQSLNATKYVISAGNTDTSHPLYLACGPDNPNSSTIVKSLDEGIRVLRKQGHVQDIMSRYGLNDWKTKTNFP